MSLLVVEGIITDLNTSFEVRISRTFQDLNASRTPVINATVFITDDSGNNYFMINSWNGTYSTESSQFTGVPGRTYILHILTSEGKEYESDPCLMQYASDIDSIYFAKDQRFANNGTERQEGITIYLDSKEIDENQHYRWEYEETWKSKVPFPQKYNYVSSTEITEVEVRNEYNWKNSISDDIIIRSVYTGHSDRLVRQPIAFIASEKSDRLTVEYSILVKQYSISKKEYDFWSNMKKVNETGGDIFDTQPYSVLSNIHNINDPDEKVLGYFQVSAVKEKRVFIKYDEIYPLHLPPYHTNCEKIEADPVIYAASFDKLYEIFCYNSDYCFVEPLYNILTGELEKLVFARPECSTCGATGDITKPDFWID
jgi:hypothetical protein